MEEWEEAEWAEREREIARVQEERLAVLKAAIDAREAEAESVAEQRLARMRRGAMREKGRKFDAVQTKRVRGLRKLELRRMGAREASAMAAEGPVSASAGRTVAEYASYASGTYAPLTREGRVFDPRVPGPPALIHSVSRWMTTGDEARWTNSSSWRRVFQQARWTPSASSARRSAPS